MNKIPVSFKKNENENVVCGWMNRISHPAPGIPEELIQEMFYHDKSGSSSASSSSREGLGLYMSQKLVKIMNGSVQYLRDAERACFIIVLEFPVAAAK